MATKLHQILALERGVKAQTESEVTRAYHDAQRTPSFQELLRRVDHFAESVKLAREYANQVDAIDRTIGAAVFAHLFTPVE
jgi:pantoate kinase